MLLELSSSNTVTRGARRMERSARRAAHMVGGALAAFAQAVQTGRVPLIQVSRGSRRRSSQVLACRPLISTPRAPMMRLAWSRVPKVVAPLAGWRRAQASIYPPPPCASLRCAQEPPRAPRRRRRPRPRPLATAALSPRRWALRRRSRRACARRTLRPCAFLEPSSAPACRRGPVLVGMAQTGSLAALGMSWGSSSRGSIRWVGKAGPVCANGGAPKLRPELDSHGSDLDRSR